ncbi:MAG: hypothetical protein M1839_003014 [Geoglossum umbratile]|nr:MAG: hypothetical protein M1839_003014 [Geoglossum umbratile]
MGTPHRGGNYNSLGKALETLVRKAGFDTNNSILRQLDENNEMLNMIQEEFMRVLENRAPSLTIYSFQEAKGLAGVQGLNSKAQDAIQHYVERINVASRVAESIPLLELPFPRDPIFVGRDAELDELETSMFSPETMNDFLECAIIGLGGVGARKTQIAVEYAYRVCESKETRNGEKYSIFWLHASSQSRFEQCLQEMAKTLFSKRWNKRERSKDWFYSTPVDSYGQPAQDVLPVIKDWFCGDASGMWIWIIDNADDEDIFFKEFSPSVKLPATVPKRRICDFLPKKAGCRIIYTSRNGICAQKLTSRSLYSKVIQVNPMMTEDAVKVVENALHNFLTKEQLASLRPFTERLVKVLDSLPLALIQATSFMKENDQDLEGYLKLYAELKHEQSRFLKEEFVDWRRDSGMPNSVLLTWKMSFELLKQKDKNASRLFYLMSILDRQGIPDWLLSFVPDLPQFDRLKALALLRSFSFITQHNAGNWQMHRLVQIAARTWMDSSEWEETVQSGLRLLCDAFMGHLCELDGQSRLNGSLEYYPHTKNVLAALETLPNFEAVERMTLDDFFTKNFWVYEGNTMNSGTFPVFARSEYEKVAKGDFHSIEGLAGFVYNASRGSVTRFQYLGLQPNVSKLWVDDADFY